MKFIERKFHTFQFQNCSSSRGLRAIREEESSGSATSTIITFAQGGRVMRPRHPQKPGKPRRLFGGWGREVCGGRATRSSHYVPDRGWRVGGQRLEATAMLDNSVRRSHASNTAKKIVRRYVEGEPRRDVGDYHNPLTSRPPLTEPRAIFTSPGFAVACTYSSCAARREPGPVRENRGLLPRESIIGSRKTVSLARSHAYGAAADILACDLAREERRW